MPGLEFRHPRDATGRLLGSFKLRVALTAFTEGIPGPLSRLLLAYPHHRNVFHEGFRFVET